MTALVSYSTGTVSVASGGTTVTGVGAIWSGTNVKPGDVLQIGNFQTVISDVTDTLHLVIPPWGGGLQSAVAYKIWQVSPQRFAGSTAMATVNELVAAFETSGFFVFVGTTETVPDPSLGDDGQYAFQPTTGKTWAKVAGVWTFLGIYKAFQLLGAWSGATAYAAGDVVTLSGSSYVCVLAHTNHTPPNVTYWQLLASIGNTGNTGPTGAGYGGTSTTSLALGTGSKVFTTQAGLAYTNGARVRATATAGATGWLEGVATYSGTTLTITSDKISGSGTGTAWNLNVVGEPGAGDLTSANNLSDVASAATAATNLGVVRYGGSQSLTAAQQAQARANINVQKKNYIINGGMQISQENGTAAGTANGYYPVDQFFLNVSNAGVLSGAQVAAATPGGSRNRLRATVTTADASVGASDVARLITRVEGYRVADLLLGTASAKTITLQFGVRAPAGTYYVALRSAVPDRVRYEAYVIAPGEANTDVVKSVTLPLDTAGTWDIAAGTGLAIDFILMAGSSFQGTAGVWASASGEMAGSNQFNFMGTNGNVFELFDVGLYQGASAPSFQLPEFSTELLVCKRHWQKLRVGTQNGSVTSGSAYGPGPVMYPVAMRATPAAAQIASVTAGNFPTTAPPTLFATDTSTYFYKVASGTGNGVWVDDVSLNARL